MADDIAAEYKGTAGNFSKALVILLTFTLIFLFLILTPYYSLRVESAELTMELNSTDSEIKTLQKRIEAIHTITKGLQDLRSILARTPEERLNVTDFMERQAENGTLYLDRCSQDYHPWNQTAIWTWCKLKLINNFEKSEASRVILEEIETPFDQVVREEDIKRFEQNGIVNPDLIDPRKDPELFMFARLRVSTLHADVYYLYEQIYNRIINENTDVLNSTEKRDKVIQEMNENLLRFYRVHDAIGWQGSFTGDLAAVLYLTLNDLEDRKASLDQRQIELSAREDVIASRIEDLEFPSGAIPVGFKEAIALFPVLLAGGSLVTSELLVKATKIRCKLHEYRKGQEAGKFDIKSFVLIFHLWLDPADNTLTKFIKFGILIIPLMGYVASCLLIQQLALLNTFEDNQFFGIDNGIFIRILYPALAAFFVYGYYDLIETYLLYSRYYAKNKSCPKKVARGGAVIYMHYTDNEE